ncbi:YbaK/EbsC family protein [Rhodovulum sp. DZ06]|uniref:YbaK/EbsC family protein n=1 Tax=Rhodovulum sp. DZ06 TaxID=3425126 RepID=UPI003D34E189
MSAKIMDPRPPLGASEARVEAALEAAGLPGRVCVMQELATTADMAAAACGCDVAQIVKSLVFAGAETGKVHLLLVSGANRVHEKRAGKAIGEKLVRVNADQVRAATGYAIGGVSPMGHGEGLPIWIDEDLMALEALWAAAGAPRSVFPVTPADLATATGGTIISVT